MSSTRQQHGQKHWQKHWQHVWIIGASSGLGAEAAAQLARSGVRVTISARSTEALAEIAAGSPHITALPLDVSDLAACRAAVAGFDAADLPDLVICAAAIYEPMPLKRFNAETIAHMITVNYLGVVNLLDPLMPRMVKRGRGHIALVGSISAYFGLPMAAAYSPAKAALHNLAEALRPELQKNGVDISVVNPGFVHTRLTEKNRFHMPQIMEVDDAAQRMLSGLARQRYEVLFPHPFAGFIKALRLLPRSWVFAFTRRIAV